MLVVCQGESNPVMVSVVHTKVLCEENIPRDPDVFLPDVENGVAEAADTTLLTLVVAEGVSSAKDVLVRLESVLFPIDDVGDRWELLDVEAVGE